MSSALGWRRPSTHVAPFRRATSSALRPRRFPLQLPVWYRAADETEWHGGVTENISTVGVAIRADELPLPSKAVTVVISLPSAGTESAACLVARGRVARTLTPARTTSTFFAVHVTRYRFHRRGSAADNTTH
ncbi:MAG: hypothetical protein DMF91_11240 [Acidobacteria bacterium]|nr:MAG: hypothetical protein DMF91_11240 [Acidobacteriota bacterium]